LQLHTPTPALIIEIEQSFEGRKGKMGKQSASIVILFEEDFLFFFNVLKNFPWKKAQIHHISTLKNNPRC
jgi:hypothetical protein